MSTEVGPSAETGVTGDMPEHGVGLLKDGRWAAVCRYHGFKAAAPHEAWTRRVWANHLNRECIVPTIEHKASQAISYEGDLTGYWVPIDLWREVRALLNRADHQGSPPASTGVDQ